MTKTHDSGENSRLICVSARAATRQPWCHPAHASTVLFAVAIVGVDAVLFLLPRTLGGLLAFVEHDD